MLKIIKLVVFGSFCLINTLAYSSDWGNAVPRLPKEGDLVQFKESYKSDEYTQIPASALLAVARIEKLKVRDYGRGRVGGLLIQGYNLYLRTLPGYYPDQSGNYVSRLYCEEERFGMDPNGRIACSANIDVHDGGSPTSISFSSSF